MEHCDTNDRTDSLCPSFLFNDCRLYFGKGSNDWKTTVREEACRSGKAKEGIAGSMRVYFPRGPSFSIGTVSFISSVEYAHPPDRLRFAELDFGMKSIGNLWK